MGKALEVYESERMRLQVHNIYVGAATVVCCGLNSIDSPVWALPGGNQTDSKTKAFEAAKAMHRLMTKE